MGSDPLVTAALAPAPPAPRDERDGELLAILDRFADRVQSISLVHALGGKETRTVIVLAPAAPAPP